MLSAVLLTTLLGQTSFGLSAGNIKPTPECHTSGELAGAVRWLTMGEVARANHMNRKAMLRADLCPGEVARVHEIAAVIDSINKERERCHRHFETLRLLEPSYQPAKNAPAAARACFEDALKSKESFKLRIDGAKAEGSTVRITGSYTDSLVLSHSVRVHLASPKFPNPMVVTQKLESQGSLQKPQPLSVIVPALAEPVRATVILVNRLTGHLVSAEIDIPASK